jgi:type 1 glutamine amidotransferase
VPHVLIYDGNSGFEHISRHEANRGLGRIAGESGAFSFEIVDQATFLRPDKLAGVDMVMFNNNVANMPTNAAQRAALESYLLAGGGAGGIHSATDANYEWDAYGEMFGARFDGHPHMGYMPEWGKARLVLEDEGSPMTAGWHDAPRGSDGRRSFDWADEYYRWREQDVTLLRTSPDVNVLLSLDTKTVLPGTQQGANPYGPYRVEFQPVAWTKTFRGAGRVFYTNLGHNGFAWASPEFRTMVLEGIRWVTARRQKPARRGQQGTPSYGQSFSRGSFASSW